MLANAPALYALPVEAACGDRVASLEFCRDGGFLGVGWGVASEPLDWQTYQRKAIARDGAVHAAVREIHDLPDGALIWTRDPTDGVFYLAMVNGPWRYLHTRAAHDCDVHNVRPVLMAACKSASQVPAAIVNRFIGGWAIQRIHDEHAARWSASLFAELTADGGERRPTLDDVLTSYLDDVDVRSLVRVYLQRRCGYLVKQPRRRPGLAAWDYVLRDGHGRKAIVRARRGWSRVPCDARSLPTDVDRVYVFSPTGTYGPDPAPNVTELDYDDIVEFMRSDVWSLPRTVERRVSHALDEDLSLRTV
jgi:hypothetical protein